ncbi:MAG TPA: hypothetical protein VEM76_11935 [Anaeromyxobacteraceae bacterium]|nr:hypothetical protein [Anaeromyxobacteraceae bacterium]
MPRTSMLATCAGLALFLALPAAAGAFAIEVGEPLPDDELPTLAGAPTRLLGQARASVFIFVRTGQDASLDALTRLAGLQKQLAGRPVRIVAVASGDEPVAALRAMAKQSGFDGPVLLDRGDALYGKLGVRLHPVVGIGDAQHRLAAYEHFRKVNMEARVLAQVRLVLGEIGQAELAQVLEPECAPVDTGEEAKAGLDARFARKLLEMGMVEQAVARARQAVERAPRAAEPHAVLAAALTAKGDCAGAAKEQQLARAAAPQAGAIALASMKPCPAQ